MRKESAGDYVIGIYRVVREEGRKWVAYGRDFGFRKEFPSLAAAHWELTGEPVYEFSLRYRSRAERIAAMNHYVRVNSPGANPVSPERMALAKARGFQVHRDSDGWYIVGPRDSVDLRVKAKSQLARFPTEEDAWRDSHAGSLETKEHSVMDQGTIKTKVADIREGDLIDLEGDEYADPWKRDLFTFEFARVDEIEDERPAHSCIVLHTTQGSFGFPPDHQVEKMPSVTAHMATVRREK